MATVAQTTTPRKPAPIRHYAHLGDVEGIAELLNGTGYLFRATGARTATLVAYNDVALFLHGLVSEVEAMEAEEAQYGGIVAMVCNPEWRMHRER